MCLICDIGKTNQRKSAKLNSQKLDHPPPPYASHAE